MYLTCVLPIQILYLFRCLDICISLKNYHVCFSSYKLIKKSLSLTLYSHVILCNWTISDYCRVFHSGLRPHFMCLFSKRGHGDCLNFLLLQVMWLWKSLKISPCGTEGGLHRDIHSGIMPICVFHFNNFCQILSRKAPVVHEYYYFQHFVLLTF